MRIEQEIAIIHTNITNCMTKAMRKFSLIIISKETFILFMSFQTVPTNILHEFPLASVKQPQYKQQTLYGEQRPRQN